MGYKVYYDEIWEIIDNIKKLNNEWCDDFDRVDGCVEALKTSKYLKGEGAENIKLYMEEVHSLIVGQIFNLFTLLEKGLETYRGGYQANIDGGDGSDYGIRYTTMVQDEIECDGEVSRNLEKMLDLNSSIRWEVNSVRNSINDLLWLAYPSYTDQIEEALYNAKSIAETLNDKIHNYESEQAGCFGDVDTLVEELKNIIHYQCSINRVPIASYVKNQWSTMCNYEKLKTSSESIINQINSLEEAYQESIANTFDRQTLIDKEEREKKAKAIKWAVTGLCVIASVVVTVATAGAAAPLVVGVVGAATAAVQTGTDLVLDEYVEKGNLKEMDWANFGKEVVISAAVGFAAGYAGASIGAGSTAKTFIKKAGQEIGENLIESGTESVISAVWDIGEGMLNGEVDEIQDVVDIAFNELKDFGENAVGDVITGIVGTALDDVIDLGEDKIFKDLKDGFGKDAGKAAYSTVTDIVKDAFEDVPGDIGKEAYNVVVRDEEFDIKEVTDNFKEKFSAENLAEEGFEKFTKNLAKETAADDKKLKNQLKNEAGKDGKVTMVQFEDGTTVLKKDYDAAKEMSKDATVLDREIGAKRNKNTREILGVRTTQGATEIEVDYDKISKADYKGKSKIKKYNIDE